MQEITIKTFEEYLKIIQEKEIIKEKESPESSSIILFRGQENHNWPLLPSLARREIYDHLIIQIEKEILEEFKRRAISFLPNYFDTKSTLEWYALAQHYGLPTRLLDWTENPLVALYFAFAKKGSDAAFRSVWMIVPNNNLIMTMNEEPPENTRLITPKQLVKRIVTQAGWFSVHHVETTNEKIIVTNEDNSDGKIEMVEQPLAPNDQDYLSIIQKVKFIPLNENPEYTDSIFKILLPNTSELRIDILRRLDRLGINQYSIFPDLEGLSGYLDWKYITNKLAKIQAHHG